MACRRVELAALQGAVAEVEPSLRLCFGVVDPLCRLDGAAGVLVGGRVGAEGAKHPSAEVVRAPGEADYTELRAGGVEVVETAHRLLHAAEGGERVAGDEVEMSGGEEVDDRLR